MTSQSRSWCPCEMWDIPGQVPTSPGTTLTSAFLNLAFRLFMAAPAPAPQQPGRVGRARGSLLQRRRLSRPQTAAPEPRPCRLRLPAGHGHPRRGSRRGGVGLRAAVTAGGAGQAGAGGSPVWGGGLLAPHTCPGRGRWGTRHGAGCSGSTLGSLGLSGSCRDRRARLCCQSDPKLKGFMNLDVSDCRRELFFQAIMTTVEPRPAGTPCPCQHP